MICASVIDYMQFSKIFQPHNPQTCGHYVNHKIIGIFLGLAVEGFKKAEYRKFGQKRLLGMLHKK